MIDRSLFNEIETISSIQTPYYLFDLDVLKNHIAYIRDTLGEDVTLSYAMKANPLLVGVMKDWVDSFEVCSPGEYRICERNGIDNKQIILSGVYKNKDDVRRVMAKETQPIYTIESMRHLHLLNDLSLELNQKIQVLIRLTSGNQFGMDEESIESIFKTRMVYPNIAFVGIQMYSGTQKTRKRKFEKELHKMETFMAHLEERYGLNLPILEFGPGLAVSYFEEKAEDSLQDLADVLEELNSQRHISLEIGRYMVASCGDYVSKVVDIKQNLEKNYAILDGGIHHVNYFGQFLGMKHPLISHYPVSDEDKDESLWEICGALCTVSDVLVKDLPMKNLEIGDALVFRNVGAYSITESIFLFLSRDMPQVIFYSEKDGVKLVRETIETDRINSVEVM